MEAALNDKTAKVPLNLAPPIRNLTPILVYVCIAGGVVVAEREAAESSELPLEREDRFGVFPQRQSRQQPGALHPERR